MECARLILGERLGRIEIEGAKLGLPCQGVEDGEVERERLSGGRARGDDDMLTPGRRLPGVELMCVERVDTARAQGLDDSRLEPIRERSRYRSPGRLDAEMRDLIGREELVPCGCDRHALDNASVIPRCLTIAGSDSGGGAGVQADLKAFAAAGCHGMSAVVALTAQNTREVRAVHEAPPVFVRAQLEAVFDDIGVDAAKTGMLFSAPIIEAVADFLDAHPVPLVVDPVMVATSGARLLREDAVTTLVTRLFPLSFVVTPNHPEAEALAGFPGAKRELAERLHELGAPAVVVTGGHGNEAVDWFFDGTEHLEIPVERYARATTHGAGCTHSATLAALLARGIPLREAAIDAARVAAEAVSRGLEGLGGGEGPVDVIGLRRAR